MKTIHKYQMKDLVRLEKENWPQISSVAGLDLLNTDIDTGPWAMAMQPMQYCKKYKLLEVANTRDGTGRLKSDWGL